MLPEVNDEDMQQLPINCGLFRNSRPIILILDSGIKTEFQRVY